jgi:hypothetical protein
MLSETNNMHMGKNHPNSSGVQAYLFFALVSFACSVALPWIMPSSSSPSKRPNLTFIGRGMATYLRITLSKFWILSQLLFAICMFATFLIKNTLGGILMVATVGISWALTQWVPLAMISAEIARMREAARYEGMQEEEDGEDETGSLMSLFNVAISAPQIIAGFLCSILFWILGGAGDGDSIAWALRVGGVASLGSIALMVGLYRRE